MSSRAKHYRLTIDMSRLLEQPTCAASRRTYHKTLGTSLTMAFTHLRDVRRVINAVRFTHGYAQLSRPQRLAAGSAVHLSAGFIDFTIERLNAPMPERIDDLQPALTPAQKRWRRAYQKRTEQHASCV